MTFDGALLPGTLFVSNAHLIKQLSDCVRRAENDERQEVAQSEYFLDLLTDTPASQLISALGQAGQILLEKVVVMDPHTSPWIDHAVFWGKRAAEMVGANAISFTHILTASTLIAADLSAPQVELYLRNEEKALELVVGLLHFVIGLVGCVAASVQDAEAADVLLWLAGQEVPSWWYDCH